MNTIGGILIHVEVYIRSVIASKLKLRVKTLGMIHYLLRNNLRYSKRWPDSEGVKMVEKLSQRLRMKFKQFGTTDTVDGLISEVESLEQKQYLNNQSLALFKTLEMKKGELKVAEANLVKARKHLPLILDVLSLDLTQIEIHWPNSEFLKWYRKMESNLGDVVEAMKN